MAAPIFEFSDVQLDAGRFELLREGRNLKLERKPMELLLLLVEAQGNLVTRAEIAKRLYVSEDTVKTHVRHLLGKMQARCRAHAVAVGFRRGIIA